MGKIVLKDPFFSVGGVDLSNHISSIAIPYGAEVQDATTGNTAGVKEKLPGLIDWSLDVELTQDYSAGAVDATLFPLVGAAAVPVIVRPKRGVKAADNPEYTGNVLVTSYPPLSGSIGQTVKTTVKLEGTGVLNRAVV